MIGETWWQCGAGGGGAVDIHALCSGRRRSESCGAYARVGNWGGDVRGDAVVGTCELGKNSMWLDSRRYWRRHRRVGGGTHAGFRPGFVA